MENRTLSDTPKCTLGGGQEPLRVGCHGVGVAYVEWLLGARRVELGLRLHGNKAIKSQG